MSSATAHMTTFIYFQGQRTMLLIYIHIIKFQNKLSNVSLDYACTLKDEF